MSHSLSLSLSLSTRVCNGVYPAFCLFFPSEGNSQSESVKWQAVSVFRFPGRGRRKKISTYTHLQRKKGAESSLYDSAIYFCITCHTVSFQLQEHPFGGSCHVTPFSCAQQLTNLIVCLHQLEDCHFLLPYRVHSLQIVTYSESIV